MIKYILQILFLGFFLVSCDQQQGKKETPVSEIKETPQIAPTITYVENVDSKTVIDTLEFAPYYAVIIETSKNYKELKTKAVEASKTFHLPINMLERVYDDSLGIIVPKNSTDEIYAGSYYPRRPFEDQHFLSIEYVSLFSNNEASNDMCLVALLTSDKTEAEDLAKKMNSVFPKITIVHSLHYMGCMH